MIVQIIGKPCSGKSNFAKIFVAQNPNWNWIDIAAYNNSYDSWLYAENKVLNREFKQEENYLVESVSGFHNLKSQINIMFSCSQEDLISRHYLNRGLSVTNEDLNYYDAIISQRVRSHIHINTSVLISYEQIKDRLKSILGNIN